MRGALNSFVLNGLLLVLLHQLTLHLLVLGLLLNLDLELQKLTLRLEDLLNTLRLALLVVLKTPTTSPLGQLP